MLRADEDTCRELCARLGVELVVERPGTGGGGNLQARARELRYEAAERLRARRKLDWIATGHTRTDLAETVLYRLATSPGRRALLGLPARRGAIVRPLLALGREEVRALAIAAGLPFRDDATNEQPVYARNRIRNEVMPVLREIGSAAEATIAETRAELAEEAEALERLAGEALRSSGADAAAAIAGGGAGRARSGDAAAGPAGPRRARGGRARRAGRERAAQIERLAGGPEGGVVELGGGVEARIEHGQRPLRRRARARAEGRDPDRAGQLPLRRLGGAGRAAGGPGAAGRSRRGPARPRLARRTTLVVRVWRDGDRMRPARARAAASPSRTSSPTARSRARCGGRCRW